MLLRTFVDKICFRPSENIKQMNITRQGESNMKSLGCGLYYIFLDLFEEMPENVNNMSNVKAFDAPFPNRRSLLYGILTLTHTDDIHSESNNELFISGVPPKNLYNSLFNSREFPEIKSTFIQFMNNMYSQVKFQQENEQLPEYQKIVRDKEFWAKRVKKIDIKFAEQIMGQIDKTIRKYKEINF